MIGRYFPVYLITFIIGACDYNPVKDEASEFYAIPVGSTIVLNSEITIPPDQVSVVLQDGVIQQHANIDFYRPNCKFEIYSISEEARRVQPDQFLITKVVDDNEFTEFPTTLYASRGLMASDVPVTITYATMMYLQSSVQPEVYRMTCKHWDSTASGRYLTIREMRKVMGEVFTLSID